MKKPYVRQQYGGFSYEYGSGGRVSDVRGAHGDAEPGTRSRTGRPVLESVL
ncbi:hypothetical protein OKW26_001970 [Paraburkholderia sp. 32]